MAEIDDAVRRYFRRAVLQATQETVDGEPNPAHALKALEAELVAVLQETPLGTLDPVEEMNVRATLAADLHAALEEFCSPADRR
ncbi:hypothetical protein [Falsiroseomonas oryziterrae]|uniref:hypothetical protein n=1 Tax=Falsiroseomonas oryziterrae TaxID=2911368 RepID=UPI001F1D0224|nr:hypothetical protein [Roseomonas sp. NPKOSM-4]